MEVDCYDRPAETSHPDLFTIAVDAVERKKTPPIIGIMRFEVFREGKAAQLMHVGPFAEEGRSIAKIQYTIKHHGL